MNAQQKRSPYVWLGLIALIPFVVAGIYVTTMNIIHMFRYDDQYFTDPYLEAYPSPGPVAIAIEQAIKNGDAELLQELSGLRREVGTDSPQPDLIMTILLESDEYGYYHYLYLDMDTFRRSTYYVKEVGGRFVYVPQDAYFYYDSGYWWDVFLPLALIWWVVTAAAALAVFVFRVGAKTRREMHR